MLQRVNKHGINWLKDQLDFEVGKSDSMAFKNYPK